MCLYLSKLHPKAPMKYFCKLAVLLLWSYLITQSVVAQTGDNKLPVNIIDSLITLRLPSIAPGCVVLIAKKGNIIYQKAFGVANIKTSEKMTTGMIFRIGSITKQYTAVSILQLIDQGKINLTDSIQQYDPDFPHKQYPITIENLLSQTSGIINYAEIKSPAANNAEKNYTPRQGVNYFKDEPLQFKPGSRFSYSNSNYYLLGYILEKITGQTYEEYLKQHLFFPAALNHTYYIHPEKIIPLTASGYSSFDGKNWEDAELQNVTILYSAGGLMANAEDLFKWHQSLIEGKLLNKSLLYKASSPFKLSDGSRSEYGYGWFIKDVDGSTTIEHSGSTDGYQTDEIYLPENDIYITALFNGFKTSMNWEVATNDIARIVLGKTLGNKFQLSDDSLKQYVGIYTFNKQHVLAITWQDHNLYVEDLNPADRLPKVMLYSKSKNEFYIKEASLQFEFVPDTINSNQFKIITYNLRGKDAEWKKTQ